MARRINLRAWCKAPRKVQHVFERKQGRVLAARWMGAVSYLVQWDDRSRSWNRRSELELVPTEQLNLSLTES